MRPGQTKAVSLGTGYQRLATLYDESMSDAILSMDRKEVANQAWISIITQAGEMAFGYPSMPTVAGHPLAVGDSVLPVNQEFIKRAWVRGTSGAVLIITPIFE